ncbi:MAG: carbohydrate ABC transporter permease, partial [Clostridia bacterium]|nr:carbohydrate ABC transporter permease [Clostridia bacterium]
GLSRFDFKFKKIEMILLILTIVIPSQMIIIPTMMNYSSLDFFGIIGAINKATGANIRINILDTPFTFYIPSLFGVGLRSGIMIFIYMQFFKGLPKELEEAASIDGAGPIRTFTSIAIPSSGVVFLTVTIFSVVWHWNDYYLSVMYMNENKPLAVAIAGFPDMFNTLGISSTGRGNAILMAAALMFVLPVLILYLILQRKFVKSIDRVGITG